MEAVDCVSTLSGERESMQSAVGAGRDEGRIECVAPVLRGADVKIPARDGMAGLAPMLAGRGGALAGLAEDAIPARKEAEMEIENKPNIPEGEANRQLSP